MVSRSARRPFLLVRARRLRLRQMLFRPHHRPVGMRSARIGAAPASVVISVATGLPGTGPMTQWTVAAIPAVVFLQILSAAWAVQCLSG